MPTTTIESLQAANSIAGLYQQALGEQPLDMRNKYPVTLKHLMDNWHGSTAGEEVKSIPVHCVVEQAHSSCSDGRSSENGHFSEPTIDLDTYAILPAATLFTEITRMALTKLGYSSSEIMGAKGAVQIKHWKALTFDCITEDADATVEEILGEMSSLATLRIRLASRAKLNLLDDVKDKLLAFLVNRSQSVLINLGCPIEKKILTQLSRGQSPLHIGSDMKDAFEQWYKDNSAKVSQSADLTSTKQMHPTQDAPLSLTVSSHSPLPNALPGASYRPILPKPDQVGQVLNLVGPVHPGDSGANYPTLRDSLNAQCLLARQRLRTSFDTDVEVPRLQAWFQENNHPSREQLLVYLNTLNSQEVRRQGKPLDLTNIIYWFKNARAAQRRGEPTRRSSSIDDHAGDLSVSEIQDGEDSYDEQLSPKSEDSVPTLPNRNAVYMVADTLQDLHQVERLSSPVIHIMPQSPEDMSLKVDTNENFDKSKEPNRMLLGQLFSNGLIKTESSFPRDYNKRKRDDDDEGFKENMSADDDNDDDDDEPSDLRIKTEDSDCEPEYDSNSNASHSPMMRSMPMSIAQSLSNPPPAHCQTQPLNMSILPRTPTYAQFIHAQSTPTQQLYAKLDGTPAYLQARQFNKDFNALTSSDDRKKRSRVFIDPLSEIPKLEKWFIDDTHPSSYMIEKYTEELNRAEYRQRFPKLEAKNVQLWFKNHRAKVKRSRMEPGMEMTPERCGSEIDSLSVSSEMLNRSELGMSMSMSEISTGMSMSEIST